MRPLLYIRRRFGLRTLQYGALLGNHLKIEMEDSPVDYNEETGEQAYENVAGEVYGGNYTVSRPPPPPSPSGSSSPPVIATCPSTMASSTNSRGPSLTTKSLSFALASASGVMERRGRRSPRSFTTL